MTDFANTVLTSLKGHRGDAEIQWSDLARFISDKHSLFTGREAAAFENILAQAICHASPYNFPMPQHYIELSDLAHPLVQSAIGMRNKFTLDRDCKTIVDYFNAAFAAVVEREYARSIGQDTAVVLLRKQLADMHAQFPELGLTFGYVGNCDFRPNCYDDRAWKFFTVLATPRCHGASDVSFGHHATKDLGMLVVTARAELEAWCKEQSQRLAKREVRSLVQQEAA